MKQFLYILLALFSCFATTVAKADEPCPKHGPLFVIREANSQTDTADHQRALLRYLRQGLETENAFVILGPTVDLDFRFLPVEDFSYPADPETHKPVRAVSIARCVTFTSVADLRILVTASDVMAPTSPIETRPGEPAPRPNDVTAPNLGDAGIERGTRVTGERAEHPPTSTTIGTPNSIPREWTADLLKKLVPARSPSSLGPIIRYGPSRTARITALFSIQCRYPGEFNDHVHISGFRLFGVKTGQQNTNERGIAVYRCIDIEISNMEIFGWGAFGVYIEDTDNGGGPDDLAVFQTTDKAPTTGRVSNPAQILVHNNYFHHNQHPQSTNPVDDPQPVCPGPQGGRVALPPINPFDPRCFPGSSAEGYGVSLGDGAWAKIYRNLFDYNRHSIATTGNVGGYEAAENLVLKGGGYHGTYFNTYTHQFDVHGTGCTVSDDLCGSAGWQFWYKKNTFQYLNGPSIKIRGHVRRSADFSGNVFAKDDRDSWDTDPTGAAIVVRTYDDIHLGDDNLTSTDDWGKYHVCDVDADGVDDLLLTTGATWWFSSMGEFPWTYLNTQTFRGDQVKVGELDATPGCDVIVQDSETWRLFSGGRGDGIMLGVFGVKLKDVAFGRFGLPKPGIDFSGSEMLIFRRGNNGDWESGQLSRPNRWRLLRTTPSPSLALSDLRFADFTGDGLTDVMALVNGYWAISEGGTQGFKPWNPGLSDALGGLYVADIDADRQYDVLKLDRRWEPEFSQFNVARRWTLTQQWYVSRNGQTDWQPLGSAMVWDYPASSAQPRTPPAFAGNFGVAPGGGVLVVDRERIGHFFAPGESAGGASPNWTSLFAY